MVLGHLSITSMWFFPTTVAESLKRTIVWNVIVCIYFTQTKKPKPVVVWGCPCIQSENFCWHGRAQLSCTVHWPNSRPLITFGMNWNWSLLTEHQYLTSLVLLWTQIPKALLQNIAECLIVRAIEDLIVRAIEELNLEWDAQHAPQYVCDGQVSTHTS